MQSVGQKLRQAREAQGRTLEQVNSSTRIPLGLLEAIEADNVSGISSAFLYKSFVRQVAEELQLDYAALKPAVEETADRMPTPLMPGQGAHGPKIAALHIGKRRKSNWVHSVSLFAIAVVACSGLYAAWQGTKGSLPGLWQKISAHEQPLQLPASERIPIARDETSDVPVKSSGPSTALSESAGKPLDRPGGFTLELSATEPAWLSIVADGKISFKGILERAETKILAGHRMARIRTGNAGGVEVVFNGKALGTLGSRGQVRTVLFTNDNYQVLDTINRGLFFNFSERGELAQLRLTPELFPGF